ncbi:MAG: LCP family protein [Geodermatophilaceae bacterium]|nr:LCP family protein [Geodermatophilaceae bacterium]
MSSHRYDGAQDPDAWPDADADRSEHGGLLLTEDEDEPRRGSRWRRALVGLLAVCLVLALLAAGAVWYLTDRYAGNVARIPGVFEGLDEESRPQPPAALAGTADIPMTFLLVGSDSRAAGLTTGDDATEDAGSQRSDVLMLLQLSGDRSTAFAISIPRDSYVPVPGYGTTKINAAYSYGGPTLLIETVEQLTNIRIDHFLSVDFTGFEAITDAIGGVDVRVAQDTYAHGVQFQRGLNHLDGEQALAYVRQRYRLPGGDFDRVQRHQNYLRAVVNKVSRENLLTDPGQLDGFLRAVTNSISVDDGLSDYDLVTMAYSLRGLQQQNVAFMTAPVTGTGMEGTASVVYLDDEQCQQMWAYINAGTLQDHLGEFEQLPATPR